MVLTLSEEKVGIPSAPTEWDNKKQASVPIPYKNYFLKQMSRKVKQSDKAEYRCDSIGDVQHYHTNYLHYLEKCWADHLGVIVTPDIIWYTLLCEMTLIIKANPKKFQDLFSTTDKKQDIVIHCDDIVLMPLDSLCDVLRDRIPINTTDFFPIFSTRTPKSLHAFQAAFCDMCSPYYNYSMLLCNIPKIDVQGTLDDWKYLLDKWNNLCKIVYSDSWTTTVSHVLTTLIDNFGNKEFWKTIFSVKRCGSGGQIEILGWFVSLFKKQPGLKFVQNYSTHISVVKYKQLNFNINYEMLVGMFGSKKEDDFMVPDFSFIVNEV